MTYVIDFFFTYSINVMLNFLRITTIARFIVFNNFFLNIINFFIFIFSIINFFNYPYSMNLYLNLSVIERFKTVKGKTLFYLQNYFILNKRYDVIKIIIWLNNMIKIRIITYHWSLKKKTEIFQFFFPITVPRCTGIQYSTIDHRL